MARRAIRLGLAATLVVGASVMWWVRHDPGRFHNGDRLIVADFENATGQSEFDTTVRATFEEMLSESAFVRVIRGARLKKLVDAHVGGGAVALSLDIASGICASGACDGYLTGKLDRSGTGYRLEVSLWKAGHDRLLNEIAVLDASYDFDAEIERLKQFAHLFPSDATALNSLAWLYGTVWQDPITTETYARAGYQIASDYFDLTILSPALAQQGKADEIQRVVLDFKSKGGADDLAARLLLPAYQLRADRKRLEQAIGLLERRPGYLKAEATCLRVTTALGEGRLADARAAVPTAWRAALDSRGPVWQHRIALLQSWLEARQSGRPAALSDEQIEPARGCLLYVPDIASFCVDEGIAGPLPDLTKLYETSEKGSRSRYVQEELEYVRGCLMLIRGEARSARRILEPLARTSNLIQRHRVLGKDYEALGLYRQAADEYDQVLKNPFLKWSFINPAMWSLDQFRLANVYQRVGDAGRAREWYGRFLEGWRNADPGIPEVVEAKRHLAALGKVWAAAPR